MKIYNRSKNTFLLPLGDSSAEFELFPDAISEELSSEIAERLLKLYPRFLSAAGSKNDTGINFTDSMKNALEQQRKEMEAKHKKEMDKLRNQKEHKKEMEAEHNEVDNSKEQNVDDALKAAKKEALMQEAKVLGLKPHHLANSSTIQKLIDDHKAIK